MISTLSIIFISFLVFELAEQQLLSKPSSIFRCILTIIPYESHHVFAVSRSRPGVNPRPRIPLLNGKSSDTQRLSVRPQNKKGVKDPQVSQTVKIKSENVNECQIFTRRRTKKQYLLLELNIKQFLKK